MEFGSSSASMRDAAAKAAVDQFKAEQDQMKADEALEAKQAVADKAAAERAADAPKATEAKEAAAEKVYREAQTERAAREKAERERDERAAVEKAMGSKSAAERAQLAKAAAESRTRLLSLQAVIGVTVPHEANDEEVGLYHEARKRRREYVGEAEALKQRAALSGHDDAVLIREVKPGSAGERAGLKKGCFVLEFDGVHITNDADFTKVLGSRTPGDPVRLKLFDPSPHGAGVHEMKVVLGAAGKTPEEVAALRSRLVPIGILPEHVIDRTVEMGDEARKMLAEAANPEPEKRKRGLFGF